MNEKTMEELKQKGLWVWYKPGVGDWEKGRVKSWNDVNIFVVYTCAGEWKRYEDFTAAATKPEDLVPIEHASHCKAELGFVCACLPPNLEEIESDINLPTPSN